MQIGAEVGFSALLFQDRWITKTEEALRHTITSRVSILLHDSHFNLSLHWFTLDKNIS